jgi:metal-dependent amidase/aminoacylase/carboxypeptidase family protein
LSNKFDRENYPSQEPNELVVGDYWVWKRDDLATDYPTDSYSLSYEFHCDSGGGGNHQFTINATEANDTYYIEVPTTTTENYNPHDYQWAAYITRTSDSARIQIDDGKTTILPNLADTNADLRSHAKKVLDNIQAVIEGRATIDQSSFSLAGRSLSRMSIDELMTFRDRYHAEYLKEVKLARIKNKQGSGNTIKTRFNSSYGTSPKSYT